MQAMSVLLGFLSQKRHLRMLLRKSRLLQSKNRKQKQTEKRVWLRFSKSSCFRFHHCKYAQKTAQRTKFLVIETLFEKRVQRKAGRSHKQNLRACESQKGHC